MATDPPPESLLPLTRRALAILIVVAFVNGIAAGVHWHRWIATWFHLGERPSRRPCPEHPEADANEAGACTICGRPLVREIAYWWDPSTTPPFVSDHPGQSPAGIELVPVFQDQLPASDGRARSSCGDG